MSFIVLASSFNARKSLVCKDKIRPLVGGEAAGNCYGRDKSNKLFHTKISAIDYSSALFTKIVRMELADSILADNHPFIRAVKGDQLV